MIQRATLNFLEGARGALFLLFMLEFLFDVPLEARVGLSNTSFLALFISVVILKIVYIHFFGEEEEQQ